MRASLSSSSVAVALLVVAVAAGQLAAVVSSTCVLEVYGHDVKVPVLSRLKKVASRNKEFKRMVHTSVNVYRQAEDGRVTDMWMYGNHGKHPHQGLVPLFRLRKAADCEPLNICEDFYKDGRQSKYGDHVCNSESLIQVRQFMGLFDFEQDKALCFDTVMNPLSRMLAAAGQAVEYFNYDDGLFLRVDDLATDIFDWEHAYAFGVLNFAHQGTKHVARGPAYALHPTTPADARLEFRLFHWWPNGVLDDHDLFSGYICRQPRAECQSLHANGRLDEERFNECGPTRAKLWKVWRDGAWADVPAAARELGCDAAGMLDFLTPVAKAYREALGVGQANQRVQDVEMRLIAGSGGGGGGEPSQPGEPGFRDSSEKQESSEVQPVHPPVAQARHPKPAQRSDPLPSSPKPDKSDKSDKSNKSTSPVVQRRQKMGRGPPSPSDFASSQDN